MRIGIVIPCDKHKIKHCVTCRMYQCTDCQMMGDSPGVLAGTDFIFCWNCVQTGIALTKHTNDF